MDEKIYFSDENIFSKISEILEKNGVKESPEEAAFKEGESFINIILRLVKDYLKEKILEKDLTSALQKQLGISAQAAGNIFKDIKGKILPLAEKIKITEQIPEERLITTTPKIVINENQIIAKEPIVGRPTIGEEKKSIEKRTRAIKNVINPPDITKKEAANFPKKPDNYREPIE